MKVLKSFLLFFVILLVISCKPKQKPLLKQPPGKTPEVSEIILPLDKGFSEYITGYTAGIVPANSAIEIRFTPEFAEKAGKQTPLGLFVFNPFIKGKTEWTDETTLVFTPAKFLDPGKTYKGELNLYRLGEVEERLKGFPIRIKTLKRDFSIITGAPEW